MRKLLFGFLSALCLHAQSAPQSLARDVFRELIEINTTDSSGDCTRAAQAMAARFRAAGFPEQDIQILGPVPNKGNLVVRYRGSGSGRPLLLIGHLDVVEARREDWSVDPFRFLEKDGYFYGRGSQDMKADDAVLVATLLQYRKEGWKPSRDIILALTADEEGGKSNGVSWLLANHRDLIDAAFAVNSDSGGGRSREGRHEVMNVGAAEKVYEDFRLEVTNPGGHSSRPPKENAIYQLAGALTRLAALEFPVHLNPVTRMFFERSAALSHGQEAADMKAILADPPEAAAVARLSASPYWNALLRTTCVATMIEGGHARNALPQRAVAFVNCRMLPGDPPEEVRNTLVRTINDPQVSVMAVDPAKPSPPSPIGPEILKPVETVTQEIWGPLPVLPVMDTGATDGLYLRRAGIPVYGISGMFLDVDDIRAHGRDERVAVKSFEDAVAFMYRLLRPLAEVDR